MIIDVSRMLCPMPVLTAKKTLDSLAEGKLLEIITDETSAGDIRAFIARMGHQLVSESVLAGEKTARKIHFLVKKREYL
ncbi:MAG: sulfurtransferase TusA family protein [Nitrospiraceae bacterium]|nr:sulfurtransferase TusA family protein [Nitrospiraceae bacterium]